MRLAGHVDHMGDMRIYRRL